MLTVRIRLGSRAVGVRQWVKNGERRRTASHGVHPRTLQGPHGWRHPFIGVNGATGHVGNNIAGSLVTIQGRLLVMCLECGDV